MIGLIATKEGMTRLFQDDGKSLPVSVLKVDTNFISQIKTKQSDGYDSIQLSTKNQKEKNQTKSKICLLYTSPSPRDSTLSRMPSSA